MHAGVGSSVPFSTRLRAVATDDRSGPILVVLFVFVVYLITGPWTNPYNQYVLLSDSFLHGHLFLVHPPSYLEVAHIHGHAYPINPPAPTLFLIPFVAVWGTKFNEVPISALVGAAASGFFWTASKRLWDDTRFRIAMLVLFAFGTNLWWAASDGGMWTYAHATAVMFATAAFAEGVGKKRPWLVGLLIGLAGLSRLAVFATFPFFAYLAISREDEPLVDRRSVRRLVMFLVPFGLCGLTDAAYNFARYGTVTDAGYSDKMYLAFSWFRMHGVISIAHVPRELYAMLFQPPVFSEGFPFLHPNYIGMALFLTTPAFLYAFRAPLRRMNVAALVGLAGGLCVSLTYWATGWSQFGYRYSLDVYIPWILLTAAGMGGRLDRRKIAVIALCVAINLWGVLSWSVFHTALT